MLIVCPACASRYEIAEAKIGAGGRKVRCASCQNTWQIEAPQPSEAPDAELQEAGLPEAEPPDFPAAPSADETAAELAEELRRAAEIDGNVPALAEGTAAVPAPRRKRAGLKDIGKGFGKGIGNGLGLKASPRLPGAALLLLGLAVLGFAFWQRDLVVRRLPQFAALYEKLGLPVNIRGLAFSAVESELVQDQQGRFLVVEGDVTNVTKSLTKMPPIVVTVKDADGKILYSWTAEPPRPTLEPSELVHFRARLASPPENGRSVQVRFGTAAPAGLVSMR